MKYAVVIFHANLFKYNKEWVDRFVKSLEDQTDQDFELFEYSYDNSDKSILSGKFSGRKHFYCGYDENYADAMNFIFGEAFETCDVVFNTNIDDYFHNQRIKIEKLWLSKYDIVSSNYTQVIDDKEGVEVMLSNSHISSLNKNYNVVSNPCHAMHKRVFDEFKFESQYIPTEDLRYWQTCLNHGFTFGIIPMSLHYYRIHLNQEGNVNNPYKK